MRGTMWTAGKWTGGYSAHSPSAICPRCPGTGEPWPSGWQRSEDSPNLSSTKSPSGPGTTPADTPVTLASTCSTGLSPSSRRRVRATVILSVARNLRQMFSACHTRGPDYTSSISRQSTDRLRDPSRYSSCCSRNLQMLRNPHRTRIPPKVGGQREIARIAVRQKPREALKISQGHLDAFWASNGQQCRRRPALGVDFDQSCPAVPRGTVCAGAVAVMGCRQAPCPVCSPGDLPTLTRPV